jgi:hypothetical protein
MVEEEQREEIKEDKSGYGKRPLWQWALIYFAVGGIIYALVYYFVLAKDDGYNSGGGKDYEVSESYEEGDSEDKMMIEVETVDLLAVGEYAGSGTATRNWDGSVFTHTVEANLSDPSVGKFYEGWLVYKTPGGPEFFSTGRMEVVNGTWQLEYTASQNYPDHNDVVITEETESLGLDNNPEAHVLEGAF